MAKSKEVFVCQNCGESTPKWQGQCAGCGTWNTLLAELQPTNPRKSASSLRVPRNDSSSSLAA
jgi:DNA repair protein RadA/Sms